MAKTVKNTHRRNGRAVTPAVRASRSAAVVAASALMVSTPAALADGGTDTTAAPQADAVAVTVAPAALPAVTLPEVAPAEQASALLASFEAPALQVSLSDAEPVVEENAEEEEPSSNERTSDRASRNNSRGEAPSLARGNNDSEGNDESDSSASEESAPAAAAPGGSILATARSYIGTPYRFGGTTPSGWDCSGFVAYVYAQHGINLPRTAGAQAAVGRVIPRSEARPGDLVYKPGHIGIYAGGNKFVDAGNSRVDTSERNIYSGNWTFIRIGG